MVIVFSEDKNEITKEGAFERQKNYFTAELGGKTFPAEAGRYRLIWGEICPWSHRVAILRRLLGLEEVISEGKVHSVRTERGWRFALDAGHQDPVLGIEYLAEIYAQTDPDYTGRATIPTIVDLTSKQVVTNDYHQMTTQIETNFTAFIKEDAPDLYPVALRSEIDALNEMLFDEVNNAVYKAGFAKSQAAYEKNYHLLFNRLDQLEARLANRRYLFGDKLTDSDIRLYVTLARFDVAYYSIFRTNRNRLIDFPNLWRYAKALYQIPAFRETTNFEAIKQGYSLGNHAENPRNLLALGPDTSLWDK
ncbi:glutathione S-transferase C-terminal domain-containing protein [Pseudolactococcus yaeyamensis]